MKKESTSQTEPPDQLLFGSKSFSIGLPCPKDIKSGAVLILYFDNQKFVLDKENAILIKKFFSNFHVLLKKTKSS
jgi:hypothetical protein